MNAKLPKHSIERRNAEGDIITFVGHGGIQLQDDDPGSIGNGGRSRALASGGAPRAVTVSCKRGSDEQENGGCEEREWFEYAHECREYEGTVGGQKSEVR